MILSVTMFRMYSHDALTLNHSTTQLCCLVGSLQTCMLPPFPHQQNAASLDRLINENVR